MADSDTSSSSAIPENKIHSVAQAMDQAMDQKSAIHELDRAALARQERLQRDTSEIKGSMDAMLAREKLLIDEVGKAKARNDLKPEVDGVIEELQKRAHDRSVGSFERMLTGITDDVLPDYKGRRTVKLELSNERNMPALDIYIDNMGKPEKITSGAVANVVSTGLRFISLARSGARRLLVLDEADCWIDGVAVQNYFNVVNQLSRDAGIQTVVITHHDLSDFSEDFRIYRISDIQSPDGVDARSMDMVSPGRMAPNELNPNHISFIGLKNIEAYPNSAIELSPGVTVIQGANQRGKSVWRRALSAACMAESGEEIIRHNNDTGEIAIGFADGRVLEYQRFRKGPTKAEFAMHSPQSWDERIAGVSLKSMRDGPVTPLHHTVGAKLPEWLPRETGVYEVEGINIQLWGQFTPVFMLDKPASARASLLSIGRESGYLFAMSETYKSDLKEDSTKVKNGEKEIAAIRGTVQEMQALPELIARVNTLREDALLINDESKRIQEISELSLRIKILRERDGVMQTQLAGAQQLIDIPGVEPTDRLTSWLEKFARAQNDAAMDAQCHDAVVPDIPGVEDTAFAQRVVDAAVSARKMASVSEKLPGLPDIPSVDSTAKIQLILSNLAQAHRESLSQPVHPLPAMPDVQATREIESMVKGLAQARRECAFEPSEGLSALPSTPVVDDTTELTNLLMALKASAQGVIANEKQLKVLKDELSQIEKDMQAATDALGGECPVCHSVMTLDMLLGGEKHVHEKSNPISLISPINPTDITDPVHQSHQLVRANAALSLVTADALTASSPDSGAAEPFETGIISSVKSAQPAAPASRLKFRR